MEITIKQLNEKAVILQKVNCKTQDKLSYAIARFNKEYQSVTKEVFERERKVLDDYRVDVASLDERNNLIVSKEGTYSFTPENYKKLMVKIKETSDKTQSTKVQFEPYLIDLNKKDFERANQELSELDREDLLDVFIVNPCTKIERGFLKREEAPMAPESKLELVEETDNTK